MADNDLMYYRGFPIVRCEDKIYYGSMGDKFTTQLTIMDSKTVNGVEVPTTVRVQLLPNTDNPLDFAKCRKGEMNSLYEALDTAYIWLTKVLFE